MINSFYPFSEKWNKVYLIVVGVLLFISIALVVKKILKKNNVSFVSNYHDEENEYETPLEALQRRYINGEITRKEYLRKRKDITM